MEKFIEPTEQFISQKRKKVTLLIQRLKKMVVKNPLKNLMLIAFMRLMQRDDNTMLVDYNLNNYIIKEHRKVTIGMFVF